MALKLGSLFFDIGADTKKLDAADKEVKRVTKQMQGSFRALGRVIVAAFSIEAARRVIGIADQMALLDVRIRNATKSQDEYVKSQRRLISISNKTGTALEGNVALFTKIKLASEEIGATNPQVLQLTESFNKLGAIGGASVDQMKNSQLQFSQAMAGGIVRAEEFNSIMENTPRVAQAIAKGLGKSTGELRSMVIEGELLSSDVFEALLSQTEDINKQFETLPVTTARASQEVANNFALIVAEINKGVEGSTRLASKVHDFAQIVLEIPNNVRVLFTIIFGELDQFFTWAMAGINILALEMSGWLDVTDAQKAGTAAQIAEVEKIRDAAIAASKAAIDMGIDDEARLVAEKRKIRAAEPADPKLGGGGKPPGPSKATQTALDKIGLLGESELDTINREAEERRELVLAQEQLTADAKAELLRKIHDEQIKETNEVNQKLLDAEVVSGDRRRQLAASQQQAFLAGISTLSEQVNQVISAAGQEGTAIAKAVFLAQKAIQVASIIAATEVAAAQAAAVAAAGGPVAYFATAASIRAVGYTSAALVAGLAIGNAVGGGRQMGGTTFPQLAHPINEAGVPEILNQAGKQYLLPTGKSGNIEPLSSGVGGQPNITILSTGTPQTVGEVNISRGEIEIMITDAGRAVEGKINASLASGRGDTARSLQTGFKSQRNLR